MYQLVRQLLFKFSAETSHELGLDMIGAGERLGLTQRFIKPIPEQPVEVMGLRFPNPVGLAAGLDKNADYLAGLGALGFGFIEVGTVTPRPQPGNPKPRLFRLPEAEAIINRMGFNNKGVDHLVEQVKCSRYQGILGINIGKNLDTPVEKAVDDYLICLNKVYPYADYVTVNISSPNTPGLRSLQYGDALAALLARLKEAQAKLASQYQKQVPLAVKIAPDMTAEEISQVAEVFLAHQIDGVIATNTTIDKNQVSHLPHGNEQGGLSGKPLVEQSTEVIKQLAQVLKRQIPIIGVGGIHDAASAAAKIEAGAALVQIYSGFIYQGPQLIRDAAEGVRSAKSSS
ncbi:quinone-dependent dihydroorotate dehydrogenase [Endozoicomonas sp. SM1973]|uniref:Dihydroorotate dehydrogenase (quinone) n=1 Tax=Spartinivicinus marinus TaxID=2994442 RepID=A0A853I796_9GAMM|nr:quinone-dependent dihydroorotate dehydrogenase [Spartinivicinus marinus]MCX4028980.1 quinone-dependent dihydroorotate dehydrogenase [Spartinivicinus marinus]NYZ65437.1 quinone-dependent dihydroorotate dehydrogenase [Spartinivicinus marinus]